MVKTKLHPVRLHFSQNRCLTVEGILDFDNVDRIFKESQPILAEQPEMIIDFSLVSHSNSAGLALMMAWCRYAKQLRKKIEFHKVPVQLIEVAKVSDLDKRLPIVAQ